MNIAPPPLATECFLKNSYGDKYLYSINRNLLNKHGANQIHSQRFDNLLQVPETLYIVVGSDSGTLLLYLKDKEIAAGTKIVIVELPEIVQRLQDESLLSTLSENVIITTLDSFEKTAEDVGIQSYVYIDHVELAKSVAADYCFLPQYQQLFFTLQEKVEHISWSIKSTLGSQPFIDTQLQNVADNIIGSSTLCHLFSGKTAVLLAGGPSLDEILPWVQEHRTDIVVLAVSRVCRRLQQIDLKPDIIFSIDPHAVSFDISKEMLAYWEDALFVHTFHVVPQLLGQWRGRSIYLGPLFPWDTELNEAGIPYIGPTVSNVALSAATEMDFSQVILAGVDLCHSKQGYTHASGSNESVAGPQLAKSCTRVETNGGWMAETTCDFAQGIIILAHQALNGKQHGVHFINPASGAAKVDNVEHVPINRIIIQPLSAPASQVLTERIGTLSNSDREKHYRTTLAELTRAQGQLLKIRELSKDAIRCNTMLQSRQDKGQNFKLKKRMDKIERKLNKQYLPFSTLVKRYGIRDFLRITRTDTQHDWQDDEIYEALETYYQAYIHTTDTLLKLVKSSKKRVQLRIEELSDTADTTILFQQWRNDKQPGRVLVWMDRTRLSLTQLPADIRTEAEELLQAYNATLSNQETAHLQRSKEYASFEGLIGKSQMYFKKQDTDSLVQLTQALENHPDKEAQKYLYLSAGYLAELNKNEEKALKYYQKLFAYDQDILLEEALTRIASISLKRQDIDNAQLALETLAKISFIYLPKYGDFLRVLQKSKEAIEVYLNYLEQVPNDTALMLKLGTYFQELHISEGAEAMFKHVLQLEPDNRLAKKLLAEC